MNPKAGIDLREVFGPIVCLRKACRFRVYILQALKQPRCECMNIHNLLATDAGDSNNFTPHT